jgi:hypothetical protein
MPWPLTRRTARFTWYTGLSTTKLTATSRTQMFVHDVALESDSASVRRPLRRPSPNLRIWVGRLKARALPPSLSARDTVLSPMKMNFCPSGDQPASCATMLPIRRGGPANMGTRQT